MKMKLSTNKTAREALELNRPDSVSKSCLTVGDSLSLPLEIDDKDVKARPNLNKDQVITPRSVIERIEAIDGSFDYDALFEKMLLSKKRDHSYRYFKKIERKGRSFPRASEHTNFEKDVIVWCSNDYMGMSWNQDVINAAK